MLEVPRGRLSFRTQLFLALSRILCSVLPAHPSPCPHLSTAKHLGLVGNGSVCVPGHTGCQTFLQSKAEHGVENKI